MSVLEFDPSSCVMLSEKVEYSTEGIIKRVKEAVINIVNEVKNTVKLVCSTEETEFDAEFCILYSESPIKLTEAQRIKRERELELKRFTPPTVEEAILDYQKGEQHAFDYAYNLFKKKIEFMARDKSKGNQMIYEDLLEELQYKFFDCACKYKGGKVKFNTFFWNCAQNAVGMYYTRKSAKKRCSEFGEVSMYSSSPIDEEVKVIDAIRDDSQEGIFDKLCLVQAVKDRILPLFKGKDLYIINLIVSGLEIKDIAKKINMTRAGVYLRWKKIKETVQHILTVDEIRDMMQMSY